MEEPQDSAAKPDDKPQGKTVMFKERKQQREKALALDQLCDELQEGLYKRLVNYPRKEFVRSSETLPFDIPHKRLLAKMTPDELEQYGLQGQRVTLILPPRTKFDDELSDVSNRSFISTKAEDYKDTDSIDSSVLSVGATVITYNGPLKPEVPKRIPYPRRPSSENQYDIDELVEKMREENRIGFYLKLAFPKTSIHFSHYCFKILPAKEADKDKSYMLSNSAFVIKRDGSETYIPINDVLTEFGQYSHLRKLRLFQQFLVYKTFQRWMHNIRFTKFHKHRENVKNELITLQPKMREGILSVQKVCISLSCATLLDAINIQNLTLNLFLQKQANYCQIVAQKLHEARCLIRDVVSNAAHSHLLDYGYVHDDSNLLVDPALHGTPAMLRLKSTADGKFLMTFAEKFEKKKECARITRFIVLIDYIVITMLHTLMKNSIEHLFRLVELSLSFCPAKDLLVGMDVSEVIETDVLENAGLLFKLNLVIANNQLRLNPEMREWTKSFDDLMSSWFNVIIGFKQYLNDKFFSIFTNPSIAGFREDWPISEGPRAGQVIRGDKYLSGVEEKIIDMVTVNLELVLEFCKRFKPIANFHLENTIADREKILNETVIDIIRSHLTRFTWQSEILNKVIDGQILGLFLLQFDQLKEQTLPLVQQFLRLLHIAIPRLAKDKVDAFTLEVDEAQKYLETDPISTLNYVEYLDFVDKVAIRADELDIWLEYLKDLFEITEEFNIIIAEEDIDAYYTLSDKVAFLHNSLDLILHQRDAILDKFNDSISKDIRKLMDEVYKIRQDVLEPWLIDINSDAEDVELALADLQKRLSECVEKAATYKSYQKACKVEVTRFEVIDEVVNEVKLRQLLWDSLTHWDEIRESWLKADFYSLNPEDLQQTIAQFFKNISQFEKGLPPNYIVPILRENVEVMRDRLPVITNLRNPNLKPRHWLKIEQILNYKFSPDETLTLKILEDIGIYQFANEITEISGQASSEAGLEALLKKIEDTWKSLEFITMPHKESKDVFILAGLDEIQQALDDTNINLSTIAGSRHVGPIKPRLDDWLSTIDLFSKTLDEWVICQNNWLFLEPIFTAPDIQRQLPNEAKQFVVVDKSFKEIMRRTAKNPLALPACTAPGLLETFITNNTLLDQILKCLEAYLESKRVIFPRFYFLSNEELIEILAQTRNPHAVQPHLRKCFDAIAKLEFGMKVVKEENEKGAGDAGGYTEKNVMTTDIVAMISPENEKVELGKGLKARGNVEDWLGKVEDSMINSLWRLMKVAITDYEHMPRIKWVLQPPAQIVLTVGMMMWATDVEKAIEAGTLPTQEKKCFSDLSALAVMVRSDLSSLKRSIITSLITLDVHARDIVTSLVENRVTNRNNFEWVKQLRYSWDKDQDTCLAFMSSAKHEYGFEYLGASPRLVVTPLTDKCYLCLMGALQLDLGGAPAGPAGTGKTETTKDLAKALAIQCVVFNCSEGLDYKMMGRFFSGLAQAGAWCCFDEFNRIDIEVLSVIAQQLITIRNAKVAKLTRFMFEGREIKLVPRCAAFITMNPGYAGRTELPDNLKSAFRPMAMMVPDYALIAEVILYSEGFESSKKLAQKMVNLFKLCSEQLSQQDHYDFGMRAVKSVLVMAGSLKRAHPDINEDVVLIRAMRDANLPKFLADDAELFQGVVTDLFPGIDIPEHDYGVLQETLIEICHELGLQPHETTLLKSIQLLETIIVRHGVMTVGPTGGGKTTVLNVLSKTLSHLYQDGIGGAYYYPVTVKTLNPKAVTMGQLYGEVNLNTMEWHDGLLGLFVRTAVQCSEERYHWIVCDGPVDAVWIESMNTVLDDNKMLCLTNSERIKLTPWVRMLFEVEDLAQASPATVSRCGMVYIDPENLQFLPYIISWLDKFLPTSQIQESLHPYVRHLFEHYLPPGFAFIKKRATFFPVKQVEVSKATTVCKLFQSILSTPNIINAFVDMPSIRTLLVQAFVFSYIWGVGGNLEGDLRDRFESFIREQFEDFSDARLPPTDLWEVYLNSTSRKLEPIYKIIAPFKYEPSCPFFDILVPTIDSVRFGHLMEMLLNESQPVMFTGNTGVGKSVIIKGVLNRMTVGGIWIPVTLNFSAQTSCNRTQEMLEEKMDKRKKKIIGAPVNKKLAVFVDDVNMPRPEKYGAMPPIELLRQYLDNGGFYDREKLYWKEVVDVVLCCACAPPGGGRNPLTARFVRHFSLFYLPFPSEQTLKLIFKAILGGFLSDFTKPIHETCDHLVLASVELYEKISAELLPTPAKSHYVFNLRDLSKCIQGILQADSSVIREVPQILRLFYHECLRVFHDRLVDNKDKLYFYSLMKRICEKFFGNPVLPVLSHEKMIENIPILLYGDFLTHTPKEDRIYEEIKHINKLKDVLQDYLMDYNMSRNKNLKLIFFMDAIEHVCRLARILRSERGNGLLVGVGGMGKQSLSKLAAHLNEANCFQIELSSNYDYNSFHEDLKKVYFSAGALNEDLVFLFTDTQIVVEEFLEDINNILNTGQVPNLFESDDYEKVIITCRPAAKEAGVAESNRDGIYDFFISRVRRKLHLIICMSPVGDSFRRRCRMFPSLVNCCTIDWFSEWPEEALVSVAHSSLEDIVPNEVENIAKLCYTMHSSVEKMTHRFYVEMRRHYYVTPSSYLDLLKQFAIMLNDKKSDIKSMRDKIKNGLMKLYETNELVEKMKATLITMEPELKIKSEATADLMKYLVKEKAAADEVRNVVVADEGVAKEIAEQMQILADDAQKDLEAALPAMEAATKALEALNKNDINEIRVFIKPPNLVKFVMEAVCLLLGAKQDWPSAKVVLGDTNFLKKLQEYDKDHISETTLKKLKVYVDDPNFQPDLVAAQSKAAKSLCLWVRAIDKYAKIFKVVEPKRKKVEEAEKELNVIMSVLRTKQRKLAEVEAQIAKLEAKYDASVSEKVYLEETIELCAVRLNRAGRLTAALSDEQERWEQSVKAFAEELSHIVGDVLIAAACVAYLGAFTSIYREELIELWVQQVHELKIPASEIFSLMGVLANQYEVRVWNTCGLPKDKVSTENAIYVTKASRWPLMIDPQEQANRWIRQMEASNELKVVKMTDQGFMRVMESAIREGSPVLIWEAGESLDPTLTPILQKAVFEQGGRLLIKIGDTDVEYDKNFRLYITTKLSNPHYLPETCIQVTLVNFTVTPSGLEDQLLADVVSLERPELEKQRTELIMRINKDKTQLKALEDKILKLLFTSEGNILDDEELVETLNISKETSAVIGSRITEAEETEEKITFAREAYRSVAVRGSCLYFVVALLSDIDPMYQFSLKYFNMVFNHVIESTEKSNDLKSRLQLLIEQTTIAIYNNVSRGLFEKHKLIFSFLLCCSIFRQKGDITESQWSFLIRGPLGPVHNLPKKPELPGLSDLQWLSCNYLASHYPQPFISLPNAVTTRIKVTVGDYSVTIELVKKNIIDSPINWDKTLENFEKMMLVKCLKEEKLVFFISEYVKIKLGKAFIESPLISLQDLYNDTSNIIPLIFVLSTGSDPVGGFLRFASESGNADKINSISLGQGQGPIAQKMIEQGIVRGDWIFLQNCHLASSWMLNLEKIVMNISENPSKIHTDFRLFLSSMPSVHFPVSVLQNSVKVTNEPPRGIRAHMKRAFAEIQDEFFSNHSLERSWRTMIFGLCLFHGIIQERKKFGPLGWNILYEFNDSDRECALLNLNLFCPKGSKDIPWDALQYTTGEITYGGRVTDYWDQRTLKTILKGFFAPETLSKKFKYSPSGTYYCPDSASCKTVEQYKTFIDGLPLIDDPEIFGMHENANIAYQKNETNNIILTIIDIQPKESAKMEGKSSDEIVYELAENIQERILTAINPDLIYHAHLKRDSKDRIPSLTTVLLQEVSRFNKMIKKVHQSLDDLKKAIKGLVLMSEDLDDLHKALLNNMIPRLWSVVAYPSLKALGSWVIDLELRLDFIQGWLVHGTPLSFWMSGLFFPQGFMTGVLQTYARKYDFPIDQLKIDFSVSSIIIDQEAVSNFHKQEGKGRSPFHGLSPPQDGVWIHGLFLEAARFDVSKGFLVDSKPGETISKLPALLLIPSPKAPVVEGKYEAPLYKTSVRAGTLSTTGHSTNFVIAILLPSEKPPNYWILKGTALLTQITD